MKKPSTRCGDRRSDATYYIDKFDATGQMSEYLKIHIRHIVTDGGTSMVKGELLPSLTAPGMLERMVIYSVSCETSRSQQ
ncbi:hypothetical protein TRAPUB_2426 [Trametes pubescens]|uniref:Uncharacterized protein n=1 Tax=Trametes pubescens TaxID=154538 RepID=A0A1M2VGL3_TRAPU|nr:hypothetical protein TRAPUB_2426 [Trametes pubescens]